MLYYEIDEDLELRFISMRYKEELFALVIDNLDYLGEWMAWANEGTKEQDTKEYIERARKNLAQETQLPLLMFLKGEIIGTISLFNIDMINRSSEVGYWLAKEHQGKGIITRSCRELIKYGFEELNLNRIVIRCATENFKSQAIPERLGFKKEGVSRQVEWLHDKFVGLVVYSLIKEEWK